jgi:thymidylate synthase (FAD)
MLLPHSTAAKIVVTSNIREWKHIFELRCSKFAHPSVQQVMIPLLLYFKEQMPLIFGDVEYNTDFPKEKYADIKFIQE